MTNDGFIYAAQEAAWMRHPHPVDIETGEPVDDFGFEEQGRKGFLAGAEWARAYLAAQEVTDAEVIAALGAANRTTLAGSRFDAPLSFYSDAVVKAMRAALSAARTTRRGKEAQ